MESAGVADTPALQAVDRRRVRSLIGLTLARLGPRAHGAVAGVFLVLLVGEHTESLVMVTLALTGHRLITWIAYPIAGRISDHSFTSIGRRVPYMAAGLALMGLFTAFYVQATSYWMLVASLIAARLAQVVYRVPGAAVTPEAFGATRWVRAGAAVTVGGIVVGLSIRITVIATWNQDDPSTWGPAYYLAAGYIAFAALSILWLVREMPAAKALSRRRHVDFREPLRALLSAPNAKVLMAALLLAVASGGAFERAFPLYARDVLGVGGRELATASLVTTVIEIFAFWAGWWLAGRINRRTAGVLAGLAGFVAAAAHLWVTALWQSVALGALSTLFFIAVAVSLTPLYLQLVPRSGGLAERLGLIWAPLIVVGMVSSFLSGIAFDLVKDYDIIWLITAGFSLTAGCVLVFLDLPPGGTRTDTDAMFATLARMLWGRTSERHLFRGEIDENEVDGAAFIEQVQDALNPYPVPSSP